MGDLGTNASPLISIIASCVPVAIGITTNILKPYVVPKQDFRKRTRLKRNDLRERVAKRLGVLSNHVRLLNPDDALRGDGREEPDLIAEYIDELFRASTIYHRLTILEWLVHWSHGVIFAAIVGGIIGGLLTWCLPVTREWVLWTAVGLVVTQIALIRIIQIADKKMDQYEDVA